MMLKGPDGLFFLLLEYLGSLTEFKLSLNSSLKWLLYSNFSTTARMVFIKCLKSCADLFTNSECVQYLYT